MQGWVGVWGRVGMWNTWFPLVATECLLPVREKTTLQREQDMRLWQYATSRAATYILLRTLVNYNTQRILSILMDARLQQNKTLIFKTLIIASVV